MTTVRRFWIEFDLENEPFSWPQLRQGVGVTGFDERDCLSMVADLLPDDRDLPPCAASRSTPRSPRNFR